MAKRHLNSKLAIILTAGGLALLLTIFLVPKIIQARGGSAARQISEGDAAMARGDWEKAFEHYRYATNVEPNNTEALLKLGDAAVKLTPKNPDLLQFAHDKAWSRAISVDPNFVEALNRLLDSYWEHTDTFARPELFARVRELADKLLAVEPNNIGAQRKKHIATVRQWLQRAAVPEEVAQESMAAMPKLLEHKPDDAEVMFRLAEAKIRQADDRQRGGQADDANRLYEEVTRLFDDARKKYPDDATIHFRASQTYRTLAKVDRKNGEAYYRGRIAESVAAAQTKMDPNLPLYDEVQLTAADRMILDGRPAEAEKIIRDYYTKQPDNQKARLAMAKILTNLKKGDKAARAEAVEILSKPPAAGDDVAGFKAVLLRELQAQTLKELAMLQIGELSSATDQARRKELNDAVEKTLEDLRRISPARHPRVLGVEGWLHFLRKDKIEAVRVLEEAREQMPRFFYDFDVLYLLARVYLDTHQPGRARELLTTICEGVPTSAPPRIMLVELLCAENDLVEARKQLAVFEKQVSQSVSEELKKDYKRLKDLIAILDFKGNPAEALAVYKDLPQETRDHKVSKANVALRIKNLDDGISLLMQVLDKDPKDLLASRLLAKLWVEKKQKDRALDVLTAAQRHYPADPGLISQINVVKSLGTGKPDPKVAYAIGVAQAEKIVVELEREFAMGQLELGPAGTPEKALRHFSRCLEIDPDNKAVLDQLWQYHVNRGELDNALPYHKKLVEMKADGVDGKLYQQRWEMARGDYAKADDLGYELVTSHPYFAASWLALGQAQQARGKFPEAVHSFQQVRKAQPNHYEASRALAECYYAMNEPANALGVLVKLRQMYENDVPVRELYLNHLSAHGEPLAVVQERQKLLVDTPQDPQAHLALASSQFLSAQHLATSDEKKSKDYLALAERTLVNGVRAFPDDVRFYAQLAELLQYGGKVKEAEALLLRNMLARPSLKDKPEAHVVLAEFYGRTHRIKEGVRALSDALVRANNDPGLKARLASAHVQAGQYQAALDTLNGIKTSDPRVAYQVFRQKVEILIAQNKLGEAERDIRGALQQRESTDLRNLLASILIDTDRPDEAYTQLERVLASEPRNESARYLKALALAKRKDPKIEEAIGELVNLKNQNPRNMQVRLLLAELYERTNKPAQTNAIHVLKEGLALVPLHRDVRMALIRQYRNLKPVPDHENARRLAQAAQADPVLQGDPAWAREEAIILMARKAYQPAIQKMMEVLAKAPENMEYRRELLDMILQFEDYDAVLRESEKEVLSKGFDAWWVRYQRAVSFARREKTSDQMVAGDPDLAVAEFDKALALAEAGDNFPAAEYVLRGMANYVKSRDGRTVGYDAAIQRATQRFAKDTDSRWKLLAAALYRAKNDFVTARSLIGQLMATVTGPVDRQDVREVHRRAAVLRLAADVFQNDPNSPDLAAARAAYEQLLTVLPNDVICMNNLAHLLAEYVHPPDPQAAKRYSSRAYDLARLHWPEYQEVKDTHGWVLTLCGGIDAQEGLTLLKQVVEHKGDFPEARYHLGEAYLRLPKPDAKAAELVLQDALAKIKERKDKMAKERNNTRDDYLNQLEKKVADSLVRAREKLAAGR